MKASRAAAVLVALVHGLWLFQYFAPAYSSPDASGYYVPARLLATEGHSWVRPESPVEYLNVHFMETPDGRIGSEPEIESFERRVGGAEALEPVARIDLPKSERRRERSPWRVLSWDGRSP